jgi:acetylornithine deacetylase/succinyl-diaminopimelate desuccinylase-like protein
MGRVPEAAEIVLADAQRICAVPAPTFAEGPRAQLVAEMFADAGVPAERDDVGNVLGRIGGDGPAVVLAAHLDTVFGPDQTIEIVRSGGRIAAPGIGDNSLAVAALLGLARRLAARPPERPVVLAATVGEEPSTWQRRSTAPASSPSRGCPLTRSRSAASAPSATGSPTRAPAAIPGQIGGRQARCTA